MPDGMTRAVRDDLAKLAYLLTKHMPKADAKEFLNSIFARQHDLSEDQAWALYVRGKDLARREREKGKAA
jgi:hypothetical protein